MSKYKTIFAFLFGAAVGSGVTWYFVKEYYARQAQEDIESVKEHRYFHAEEPSDGDTESSDDDATSEEEIQEYVSRNSNKPSVVEYAKILSDHGGYTPYGQEESEEDTAKPTENSSIHVIKPEEFGEAGYDEVSLRWYSDHILADDSDEIIEDIEGTVGFDSLTQFGRYEDDSVFVRDDRLQIDYEILLDQRSYYGDVLKEKPYLRR